MEESSKILTIILAGITATGIVAYHFFNLNGIGPLVGVVVGSIVGYFAQSKAQKRLWKRDFIIENIKTIYGPLYNASLKIDQSLLSIENVKSYSSELPVKEWSEIQNTYTYHMIDDEELRKEIENFYVIVGLFNELVHHSWRRTSEIIQARGSAFYEVKVRDIIYNITTSDGGSSPSNALGNCMLFKIHPRDANYFKTGKPSIQVSYQEGPQVRQLILEKPEEIQKFDELWEQLVNDATNDTRLQQLETMKLQIHSMNVEIGQRLVKKINERHKL